MRFDPIRMLCIGMACAAILKIAHGDEYQRSPVVETDSGAVVGKVQTLPLGKSVHEYLGIPYGEPPVGELRFAAPKPAKPWSAPKNTTEFGAWCPQPVLSLIERIMLKSVRMSEDCLFLNVFVPSTIKPNDKMAVMVWIHGGGFSHGSSSGFPGGVLAAINDVIVVSVNYRLGVLGFFNVPGTDVKGNYGILDQVQALKWIQVNIANFGGDPNRVTIFGQSAGAISVSLHLISPLSKGLFQRAIMQSGASSTPLNNRNVTNTNHLELFASYINCSMEPDLVECVRGKAVETILTAQKNFTLDHYKPRRSQDFVGPIVDGNLLPDLPENMFKAGKFHPDVVVIAGVTSNEGAMCAIVRPFEEFKDGLEHQKFVSIVRDEMHYAREKSQVVEDLVLFQYTDHADSDNKSTIRQSMMEACGDSIFDAPVILEAKALAKGKQPPYVYVFDYRAVYSPLPEFLGVIHGMDVPFVFGAPFKNIPDPLTNIMARAYSELEKGLSFYVMKLWTDFAKHGTPNPLGPDPQVTWPPFRNEEQAYLVLDLKPRVERRYKAEKIAFWNEIVPKVLEFTKKEKLDADEKRPRDEL